MSSLLIIAMCVVMVMAFSFDVFDFRSFGNVILGSMILGNVNFSFVDLVMTLVTGLGHINISANCQRSCFALLTVQWHGGDHCDCGQDTE